MGLFAEGFLAKRNLFEFWKSADDAYVNFGRPLFVKTFLPNSIVLQWINNTESQLTLYCFLIWISELWVNILNAILLALLMSAFRRTSSSLGFPWSKKVWPKLWSFMASLVRSRKAASILTGLIFLFRDYFQIKECFYLYVSLTLNTTLTFLFFNALSNMRRRSFLSVVITRGNWANLYSLWSKSASPANARSRQCRIPMISGRLCLAGVWGSYDRGNLVRRSRSGQKINCVQLAFSLLTIWP